MRISSVKIDKLFEIFDYNISLSKKENVLIITGPNGFGKTMILNIIFNLFNKRFTFFRKLVFEKITLALEGDINIIVEKKFENEKHKVFFSFLEKGKKIDDDIEFSEKFESDFEQIIRNYLPLGKMHDGRWIDHRTDRILTLEEIINEYSDELPTKIKNRFFRIKNVRMNEILDSIKVHLIREQRLFKKVDRDDRTYQESYNQTIMTETIQSYSKELKQLISQNLQQSFKVSQQLDSTYPDRLVRESNKLTEEEYNKRFEKLNVKREILSKNALYESEQKFLPYSKDDSKALLVYLNDLEQKLAVFDDLLEKLELFTSILNERRFTFKTIQIDREKGFYFKTSKGKELLLMQLSSGEQHEVVLLYELIFNAKQNVLVLIDEPEISLHITWQKEFLNDLLKIIKIQNMQVMIATHSPSIINDRWDLVYNLEKDYEK